MGDIAQKKAKSSKSSQKPYAGSAKYKDITDKELFLIYSENKDIELRNELVKRHLYIAEILSKKFLNKGIEYEDIYQVASLGLIFAIERFDVSKGFEFSSFATPTIIGEIKKYFRDKGWSIRVPRRIQELSKKVNTAKSYLQQELHRVPKIEDDDKSFNMIENKDFIENALSKLNEIETKIIKDRFFKNKTQMHVANDLGVSQMTVSRMEKKILAKLKKDYEKSLY